jgi:hypothetical protein
MGRQTRQRCIQQMALRGFILKGQQQLPCGRGMKGQPRTDILRHAQQVATRHFVENHHLVPHQDFECGCLACIRGQDLQHWAAHCAHIIRAHRTAAQHDQFRP